MVDQTSIPTLDKLQAQFPYDPETETIPTLPPAPPNPINIDNVIVFELYDWNAFTMKLPDFPFITLHFIGKSNVDGRIITHYTSPLQPYDKNNDWYMPIKDWSARRPFRLTGIRDMYAEFPQSVINAMQATEIMPIASPESYRYPHFNPSEQNAE
jgi:hypothetical protein